MAELHQPHAARAGADATSNLEVHHEHSDVNIRAILMFGVGLIVVGVVISLAVGGLFRYLDNREARRQGDTYLVHGRLYGTLVREVEPYRQQGLGVLLDIDVQGAEQVRRRFAECVSIFLRTSTLERGLPTRPGQKP